MVVIKTRTNFQANIMYSEQYFNRECTVSLRLLSSAVGSDAVCTYV